MCETRWSSCETIDNWLGSLTFFSCIVAGRWHIENRCCSATSPAAGPGIFQKGRQIHNSEKKLLFLPSITEDNFCEKDVKRRGFPDHTLRRRTSNAGLYYTNTKLMTVQLDLAVTWNSNSTIHSNLEWIPHSKLKQLKLRFWVRSISVGLVVNFGLLVNLCAQSPNHKGNHRFANMKICIKVIKGTQPPILTTNHRLPMGGVNFFRVLEFPHLRFFGEFLKSLCEFEK